MTEFGGSTHLVEPALVGRAAELETLAHHDPGQGRLVVLTGAPGRGSTSLLAATALRLAEHHAVAVLRCAPLHADGYPRLYRVDTDGYQQVSESEPNELIDRVRLLVDEGEIGSVVIDDLHLLPEPAAERLASLATSWSVLGTEVRIGLQPCASPGSLWCPKELGARSWMTLAPLADDHVWRVLTDGLDGAAEPYRELLLALAQGSPGVAVRIREHLRPVAVGEDALPESVVLTAAEDVVAERLASRLPRGAAESGLAAVSALIWPEGCFAHAAQLTGCPRAVVDRCRDLFREVGLYPEDPGAAEVVRRAVVRRLVDEGGDGLVEVEEQVLSYLERHAAGPHRSLETLELLGRYDGRYFELALQIVDEARECGDLDVLRRVADRVLLEATNREQTRWGRQILLEYARRCDWAETARLLGGAAPQVSAVDQLDGLSPLFAVEHPRTSRRLVRRVIAEDAAGVRVPADTWCTAAQLWLMAGSADPGDARDTALLLRRAAAPGACDEARSGVQLTRLVALAFRGAATEHLIAAVASELQRSRAVADMCPVAASLLAVCHLALDDIDAAHSWARIGVGQSDGSHRAERGVAHLVSAHALLRTGRTDDAISAARAAEEDFRGLGARRLADAAHATAVHAGLEPDNSAHSVGHPPSVGHQEIEVPGEGAHGLVRGYVSYVAGRAALAGGQGQDGVDQLFVAGKMLHSTGIRNPTVIAWRSHAATVFRASRDEALADWMTADMTDAVLRWQRSNPRAGQLRSDRMREATGVGARPDAAMAARAATVSEAELRVVRLVLEGHSNAEVAARLFLSKRTIDTHLTNVYRKLGIGSRRELVAAMTGVCRAPERSGPSAPADRSLSAAGSDGGAMQECLDGGTGAGGLLDQR